MARRARKQLKWLVFVETNIFLDFYRQPGENALRQLKALEKRRLYIARDDDPAGDGAMTTLIERAFDNGIEAIVLSPRLGDFNEDLRMLGPDALRAVLRAQVASRDIVRFMAEAA